MGKEILARVGMQPLEQVSNSAVSLLDTFVCLGEGNGRELIFSWHVAFPLRPDWHLFISFYPSDFPWSRTNFP